MSASHMFPIEEYIGISFFYSRARGRKQVPNRLGPTREIVMLPARICTAPLRMSSVVSLSIYGPERLWRYKR
jgi:hypothetical protein